MQSKRKEWDTLRKFISCLTVQVLKKFGLKGCGI